MLSMKIRFSVLILLLSLTSFLSAAELPKVTHYRLRLQVHPQQGTLQAAARMTLINEGFTDVSEVPLLLYRLLDVQKVTSEGGTPLAFTQTVVKLDDAPVLQASAVSVRLPKPLKPKESTAITVEYAGAVLGYAEVMAYVHDRVDEKYTLLRPDSFAYPLVATPSIRSVFATIDSPFTYEIATEVPEGHVAACGGDSQSQQQQQQGKSVIFLCSSKAPTWRMDIAVAKFKVLNDSASGARVYAMPEDEAASQGILKEMNRALDYYRTSFGDVGAKGYAVIEIPEGWGSQASVGYILQAAAAFKDPQRISELYHEIAHGWNIQARPEIRNCRWFDEAFGTYLAARAVRKFQGDAAFQEYMEGLRKRFLRLVQEDSRHATTPIAEYGGPRLGDDSYTKGAWSLYVLEELIGPEAFDQTIRQMLHDYRDRGAGFQDFLDVAAKVSGRDLRGYAQEWIYGAGSSQQLADRASVESMVSRVR